MNLLRFLSTNRQEPHLWLIRNVCLRQRLGKRWYVGFKVI